MNEIIESLAALLERGVIVEPYGESWPSSGKPAFRIRLNDEEQPDQVERPDHTIQGW